MQIDSGFIERFEKQLNLMDIAKSGIPARILGFGEISCIFQIADDQRWAYKRLPLFNSALAAQDYLEKYREYTDLLRKANIELPLDSTEVVHLHGRPIVLYIAQEKLPSEQFAHRLIHHADQELAGQICARIIDGLERIWSFNTKNKSTVKLAIDGQLSNWVIQSEKLIYIDTSTPLYKKNEKEQLDPELLLHSTPSFLRWIIRKFFLADVMNRYYDRKKVYIDLTANLFKEGRSDLIPLFLNKINSLRGFESAPIQLAEVRSYYKNDKWIWMLFMKFRKIDRWLHRHVWKKRYEFLLPGPINR